MRGRGLKEYDYPDGVVPDGVAPRAGAWVEREDNEEAVTLPSSLPVRGRGLKESEAEEYLRSIGRSPCGGVG